MIQPLPIGNAIRLFLSPPTGAVYWRVLKMATDSFTGAEDLDYALLVHEGTDLCVLDAANLINETGVFYKPYYRMPDDTWQAADARLATPKASYEDCSTDAKSIVRDRLEAGLLEEVKRGELIASLGYVQVYTAPPSLDQKPQFPLVTITLEDESPSTRAIGENVMGDEFDPITGEAWESEGWIADVKLQIIGWSLNSDERIALRKAIRRIIIGNLPVFAAMGLDLVHLTATDVDAVSGEYDANMYQTMNTFTCIAPVRVGGSA